MEFEIEGSKFTCECCRHGLDEANIEHIGISDEAADYDQNNFN